MKRKKLLAGTKIFIDNDLSYANRKRQGERRWVKIRKEEGWNIREGYNKILVRGHWRRCEKKEQIEQEMGKSDSATTITVRE